MSTQIILSWTVSVENSPFGPTQAAAALAAVELYENPNTDPVLGQFFGLSVDSDSTTSDATSATRTLTLNTFKTSDSNAAPPAFPCHPRTSTPPELPYPLRKAVTLPGSFFVTNGLMNVKTTASQIPSLNTGDVVQFMSQQGVFYQVATIGPTSINLTAAYTGVTQNTRASKEVAAPITIPVLYSTSDLDTAGVATVPAIAGGAGAQSVIIEYTDSNGVSSDVIVNLTGRRPVAVALDPSTVDIAVILTMSLVSVGNFGNSVGQITLADLSSALPDIPSNATPADFYGHLTDEAQMLIESAVAYMPPSYNALAQQGNSAPALPGDFLVTTGSKDVPTTEDQTGLVAGGDILRFAVQPDTVYTIEHVTPSIIRLTTVFTGIDTNNTGSPGDPNVNAGTKGNLGPALSRKPTGAVVANQAIAQQPSSDELSAPLGQFVQTETAQPPPSPPLAPATILSPTFLSGLFTRTLQLALKNVPVVPAAITIA